MNEHLDDGRCTDGVTEPGGVGPEGVGPGSGGPGVPGGLPSFHDVAPAAPEAAPWGYGRANAAPSTSVPGTGSGSIMPHTPEPPAPPVAAGPPTGAPPAPPVPPMPGSAPGAPASNAPVPPVPYWRTAPAAPPVRYASWLERVGARLLDSAVIGAYSVVLLAGSALLGWLIGGGGGALIGVIVGGLFYTVWTYYYTWHGLASGHTVGRRTVGYYIAREDGQRISVWYAIWRDIVSMLSALVFYVGFLAPLWSPKRQTWHDSLTGTVAIVGPKPNVKGSFLRPMVWTAVLALVLTTGLSLAFGDAITEELETDSAYFFGESFESDEDFDAWMAEEIWWDREAFERCEPLVYLELLEDRVEGATHHVLAEFSNGCDVGVYLDDPLLFIEFEVGECFTGQFFDFHTEPVTVPSNQLVLVNLEFPTTDCAGPITGHRWMWSGVFSATLTEPSGPERVVAEP